jgi:23S rRNA (uracil1939-C5)-methyltransferase
MDEVKIEKWVYGGAGLARTAEGVALVPFTMPGEAVRVEDVRRRAGVTEARAAEIVGKSPERIEPACAVFGRCGGCHYQMAPYEFQIEAKLAILREVFERVGKLMAPEAIRVVRGEPWGYRNRSQFHFGHHTLGYKMAGSDKVVDVEECPVSAPAVNAALKALRAARRDRRFPRFLKQVELFTNGERTMVNVLDTEQGRGVAKGFFAWLAERIPGAADGELVYEACGEKFRVSHRSFFQVNRFLIEPLVGCALEGAEGDEALDLYAGVGLFTVPLARRTGRVTGVESDGSAARDLEFNLAAAGVTAEARRMQAEQYLEGLTKRPDFVLADPPRAGLGKRVVKELIRLRPPRLNIVSCDPATLARDAAALCGAGYEMEGMALIDLFPQTYHMETVARLRLP